MWMLKSTLQLLGGAPHSPLNYFLHFSPDPKPLMAIPPHLPCHHNQSPLSSEEAAQRKIYYQDLCSNHGQTFGAHIGDSANEVGQEEKFYLAGGGEDLYGAHGGWGRWV